MIATTTTQFTFSSSASALPQALVARQRRHISPAAGRALEKLGHAIEYLSQVFVEEEGAGSLHDTRLEAIDLLMSLNREIYFECPEEETPTLRQRILAFLRR